MVTVYNSPDAIWQTVMIVTNLSLHLNGLATYHLLAFDLFLPTHALTCVRPHGESLA